MKSKGRLRRVNNPPLLRASGGQAHKNATCKVTMIVMVVYAFTVIMSRTALQSNSYSSDEILQKSTDHNVKPANMQNASAASSNEKHDNSMMKKPTIIQNKDTIQEYKLTCVKNKNATNPLPDNWCMDMETLTPRFVGPKAKNSTTNATTIRHYTHDGYEQCLANKTIVFIGDSRIRYQYTHLASFLQTKKFMKCEDYYMHATPNVKRPNVDRECSLIHERHKYSRGKTWTEWYQQSDQMLASNYYNNNKNENNSHVRQSQQQYSLCDCFRPDSVVPGDTFENRYVQRFSTHGTISLIYLQSYVNKVHLNQQYPPFAPYFLFENNDAESTNDKYRCSTGYCGSGNRTSAFQGDLNATLWQILPKLNATHAFVNLGWEHLYPFPKQAKFICNELQAYQQKQLDGNGIQVYFMTHPSHLFKGRQFNFQRILADCPAMKNVIVDRTVFHNGKGNDVLLGSYWDGMHVFGMMNQEFNHQLMETICPIT